MNQSVIYADEEKTAYRVITIWCVNFSAFALLSLNLQILNRWHVYQIFILCTDIRYVCSVNTEIDVHGTKACRCIFFARVYSI